MTIILALAALAASFTVGMIFGVGFYRAGQVRGIQAAEPHLYRAANIIETLVIQNTELIEQNQLMNSLIHSYEEEEADRWEDDHDGITCDTPSVPLSENEYEQFWKLIEGDDK